MTKKDLLKKFDLFLADVIPSKNPEVNLEDTTLKEFTLDDGTIVSYPKLEVGEVINVVAEDKTLSPLENGDYVIDGNDVTIEDGKIKTVKKVEEAPEVENTEVPEVEAEEIQQISVWTLEVTNTSFKEGDIVKYLDYDKVEQTAGSGEFQLSDGRRVVTDATGKIVLIKPAEVIKDVPVDEPGANLSKQTKEADLELAKQVETEVAKKELELQADFDKKLEDERLKFKFQLEELANDVKLSSIVQAPIEDKTPKAPLTQKDKIILEIEKKRKS